MESLAIKERDCESFSEHSSFISLSDSEPGSAGAAPVISIFNSKVRGNKAKAVEQYKSGRVNSGATELKKPNPDIKVPLTKAEI